MNKENNETGPRSCPCRRCQQDPHGPIAKQHRNINRLVALADERSRRLLVGFLAEQQGRGGISLLSCITGLDRNTIARGVRELHGEQPLPPGRIRQRGGGRKRVEVAVPGS
jgi:hypothetical protein